MYALKNSKKITRVDFYQQVIGCYISLYHLTSQKYFLQEVEELIELVIDFDSDIPVPFPFIDFESGKTSILPFGQIINYYEFITGLPELTSVLQYSKNQNIQQYFQKILNLSTIFFDFNSTSGKFLSESSLDSPEHTINLLRANQITKLKTFDENHLDFSKETSWSLLSEFSELNSLSNNVFNLVPFDLPFVPHPAFKLNSKFHGSFQFEGSFLRQLCWKNGINLTKSFFNFVLETSFHEDKIYGFTSIDSKHSIRNDILHDSLFSEWFFFFIWNLIKIFN